MSEKTMTNPQTPEMVGINFRVAKITDLDLLRDFLSKKEIDGLFTPRLSDPVRGITISDRVKKKFDTGAWVIAERGGMVVGSMAIVPTNLSKDVPSSEPEKGIKVSEGIPLDGWDVEKIVELSTVVTDPKLKSEGIKGVGAGILAEVKTWVMKEGVGKWGLVTDSWIGGDMGGFVAAMNKKAFKEAYGEEKEVDTLVRVYSDPGKRGPTGPLTVIYGIPISKSDWEFFLSKQTEIRPLREIYQKFE